MSTNLLRCIAKRAEQTFQGVISLENFPEWEKHWIVIAKQVREESRSSGEAATVEEIDRILEWNLRNQELRKIISMKR